MGLDRGGGGSPCSRGSAPGKNPSLRDPCGIMGVKVRSCRGGVWAAGGRGLRWGRWLAGVMDGEGLACLVGDRFGARGQSTAFYWFVDLLSPRSFVAR